MLKKALVAACAVTLFASQATALPPVKYTVDANHSTVGFAIPILDGVSSVRGKFTDFKVDIDYDETDLTKSSVSATINAASIDTGVDGRDKHLRSADFFDVDKYPEITFQSTRVVKQGKDFAAVGTLTMHGVAKEITLPFKSTGSFHSEATKKRLLGFSANLELNRRDYGINWKHSQVANWVGDAVRIELVILVRN